MTEKTVYAHDEDLTNLLSVEEWDIAEYKGTLIRPDTKAEDVLSRIGYHLITGQFGKAMEIYDDYSNERRKKRIKK